MKLVKRNLLIAAVASVVSGLLLCFGAFAAMGFDFSRLNTLTFETHTYTVEDPFVNLSVDSVECDVRLLPSEDGSCKVVCRESVQVDHTVRVVDGTLTVERTDHRHWYERIFGFHWGSMEITVYLPESVYETLSVTSVSGDVEVPANFSFTEAKVESTSGDVRFLASVEKDLSVKTVSGDVTVDSVRVSGTLTAKTVSGDLSLSRITCGSINAETTSGDVDCTALRASGNLRIKTVSGDVELRNCDGDTLWIKTISGDVSGRLLTEKRFVTDTTSGRVRVPNSASGGTCEVTTVSGDIEFTIG